MNERLFKIDVEAARDEAKFGAAYLDLEIKRGREQFEDEFDLDFEFEQSQRFADEDEMIRLQCGR